MSHDAGPAADDLGAVPPVRPRRLTRSRVDRKIAGVAGGIARYFGIDSILVRLGFVVTAFVAGTGLIAYIIAWIVVPAAEPSEDLAAAGERRGLAAISGRVRSMDGSTVLAIILLVAATTAVISGGDFGGVIILALALVGFGIYLLHQGGTPRHVPAPPAGAAAPTGGDDTTARLIHPPEGAVETLAEPAALPPEAPRPSAPSEPIPAAREPATITRVTLAAVGLIFAAALLCDRLGWLDSDPSTVIAIGLVAVGTAAVVAAIAGHGRGLVPAGALLSLAFAVSLVAQPALEDGVGERVFAPSRAALAPLYELGIGRLELDLSELQLAPGEQAEVRVELGMGEALIRVPVEVDLVVTGEVGLGELSVLGESQGGIRNELSATEEGPGDSVLVVDLSVGVGEGVVERG